MNQPILATENLGKRFGAFVALNRVSVAFAAGELTAIIGPNGAGKSTFFNLISGTFAPSSGTVRFNGLDITNAKPYEFARMGIAKSFQITNVFPQLSALENVRIAVQMSQSRFELLARRAAMTELSDRASALLERVGLWNVQGRTARDLAHGQQRCLEVAMALACDPKLLLLDEPTAGMSPEETLGMMNLIAELGEKRSVILVEHKMKLVMGICKRIIVLHQGALLAEGTPGEIRANEEVKRVYLGQSI